MKEALTQGVSLLQAALNLGVAREEDLRKVLDPETMVGQP